MEISRSRAVLALVLACFAPSFLGTRTCRADPLRTYTYVFRQRVVKVPIGEIDGVRYNDVCLKNEESCQALRAFRNRGAAVRSSGSSDGSAHYCAHRGGSALLLTDSGYNSSLFCVFEDLSMVDARALFSAHAKNRQETAP